MYTMLCVQVSDLIKDLSRRSKKSCLEPWN